MSRRVRMVVADWDHPRDAEGNFIPMHERFPYDQSELDEGLRDGWLENNPPHYGLDVMPQWPNDLRIYYQMYETVTEGTPISPAFETPQELAQWLSDNQTPFFAGQLTTYEHWLAIIQGDEPGLPTFFRTIPDEQ